MLRGPARFRCEGCQFVWGLEGCAPSWKAGAPQGRQKEIRDKGNGLKYITYFHSLTGTHGNLAVLERLYVEATRRPDIVELSIATRPDCLGAAALAMLSRLAGQTPLWVEPGCRQCTRKRRGA